MADDHSTPLIVSEIPTKLHISVDEFIEQNLGGFGWAKFMQIILVSIARFFDAQQTFISIYTDAQPTWHCTSTDAATCNSTSSICDLPNTAWAWDDSATKTIISEWNLQCASSIITGLPASSFFFGCLLGGFTLSTLADTCLGRKKLLFISYLIMSVSSLLTSFSTSIWFYSVLRFLSGFGRASIGTCALVLVTEMVGKRWRCHVANMVFFMFSLGYLSLPAIAYMNRNSSWRVIYLWTSVPAIVYSLLVLFFVIESPRWLIMHGHQEEAMAVLNKIAPPNNSFTTLSTIVNQETSKLHFYSSMKTLFIKRWAVRRIVTIMVLGFGVGMVYYGISLGVEDLGFNVYLSVMFNGLMEIPSYFLTAYLIERWTRKSSILAFCTVSGLCSIMCGIVGSEKILYQFGLEVASFFSAFTAYNVLLIFTMELFPTCLRNSATSMVRQAQVFGAVFSPILISAGRTNELMSYGLFGLVILLCGVFVICLPETWGDSLCDTVDEQERKDNIVVN